MIVRIRVAALRESRLYEYVIRFGLGGLTTVLAGLVAEAYGPETGGVLLALPAIFCASATLIERHERKRKEQAGVCGALRAKDGAALDASGTMVGSFALGIFAAVIWFLAPSALYLAIAAASAAWSIVAVGSWYIYEKTRRSSL
jgi:hypothetical protein